MATTVKKSLIRAWNELAPKVIAFLATGLTASTLITVADTYFGLTLEPGVAAFIVTAVSFLAGYLKKDTITIGDNGKPFA